MNNQHLVQVLLVLLKQEDFITVDDIAESIDASNRTVRNVLDSIEPLLDDLKLSLLKKPGSGVKIEGSKTLKLKAYDTVYAVNLGAYPNGPQARVNYMALKLTTVDSYKISEFASDLFVSQASIHKDLRSLKTLLNKYQIQVVRNKGKALVFRGKKQISEV